MYEEYGSIRYFYEQHLRDSKQREKQRELMRALRGDDQPASLTLRMGRLQRILRSAIVRIMQPAQETNDVHPATAH